MEMQIVGRLTKEAQVKTTTSGKQVINFDVAVNERYRVKATGELKSNTKYVECSMWYGVSMAQYLTKGKQLLLTGDVGARAYVNKDKTAVGRLTLRVRKLEFLGSKAGDINAASMATVEQAPATAN